MCMPKTKVVLYLYKKLQMSLTTGVFKLHQHLTLSLTLGLFLIASDSGGFNSAWFQTDNLWSCFLNSVSSGSVLLLKYFSLNLVLQ